MRIDGLQSKELIEHLQQIGIAVDRETKEVDRASLQGSRFGRLLEQTAGRSGGTLTWSIIEQPELKVAYQRELSGRIADGFSSRAARWADSISFGEVVLSDREQATKAISRLRSLRRDLESLIDGLSQKPHRAGELEEKELFAVLLGVSRVNEAFDGALEGLGRGSKKSGLQHEVAALSRVAEDYRAGWAKSFGKTHAAGVGARAEAALERTQDHWRADLFEAESTLSTMGRHRSGRELMKKYFVGETFAGELEPWVQGDDRYYVLNEAAICSVGCLDFGTAEALFQRNMKIFEDSASQIASHHNLAELYLHAGDWPRMETVARAALALAEKDENADAIRDSSILLGTALARAGKKPDEVFARALAIDATSPATDIWGVMLADYLISRGRFEQADAHLQTQESPAVQAVVERARGDLALAMGAKHEAAVRYDAALELVRSLDGEAPHVAVEVENAVANFKRRYGGSTASTDGIQT